MTAADEPGDRGLEALAASVAEIPLPGSPVSPPAPAAPAVSPPPAAATPAAATPTNAAKSALDDAVALHRAGKYADALAAYDAILLATPRDVRAWVNQGVVLRAMGRLDAAASCYRRAIALEPGNAGIHSNLGNVLRLLERHDEALEYQRRALALDPANHAAEYNMALALRDLGRASKALDYFDRCIAGGYARPDVLVDHAAALLAAGDYAHGFAAYEARLQLPNAAPGGSDAPVWDGGPLEGKSILVQAEAGTRDTLTFLRYLPALAARGARVMASAPASIASLVATLPGVAMVVPTGRAAPATDLRIALNSLPLLFGTLIDTVPQEMPYLAVPPGRRARQWLTPPMSGERKVGIVWSDRTGRACPFAHFLRLAAIPGVALYRLQTGAAAAERDQHATASLVRDIDGVLADLADAAEAIGELDLVVGVDSAALILAGALGKPGIAVLPVGADWRWAGDGDRSLWFPTIHVFRQRTSGDWAEVFERVADALTGLKPAAAAPPRPSAPKATPPAPAAIVTPTPDAKPAAPPAQSKPPPPAVQPLAAQPPAAAQLLVRAAQAPKAASVAAVPASVIAAATGPRLAVRRFLDEHLLAGDVLVEAGMSGESFALGAVLRHPGAVRAIAIDMRQDALDALRGQAEQAGLSAAVETLRSGLGAKASPAQTTVAPRTTLDALLRDRRDLAGRVFLCLGAGERASEIVAGAMDLLAQGRIAVLLWRAVADEGADAARRASLLDDLGQLGFGHFRLPDDDLGGKLLPYVALPEPATVFSLARAIDRRAGYVGTPQGGAPLLEEPRYALLDAGQRRARTATLALKHATDAARWADPANLDDGAEERARFAGPYLVGPNAREPRVLDLGAGLLRLERHLPPGTRYVPADLALRSADTMLVDLNQGEFPTGAFDAIAMLDVLEFVHDAPGLLQRARAAAGRLVLTYRLSDGYDLEARAEAGWFNAFVRSVLESHLAIAGWVVNAHHRSGVYDLFVCDTADPGA